MTSTTSGSQRTRTGGVIVLSVDQGHDPDDPEDGGLTDRSGGYQAPMTQTEDSAGQDHASEANDGPRVLVVDDAAAIRNALRGVLEDAGIQVVGEASDGAEGVAMTGALRPDVVLMDLRMPAADGFEATARIVKEHPMVVDAWRSSHGGAA